MVAAKRKKSVEELPECDQAPQETNGQPGRRTRCPYSTHPTECERERYKKVKVE